MGSLRTATAVAVFVIITALAAPTCSADSVPGGPDGLHPESSKHRLAEAAAGRERLAAAKAFGKSWAPDQEPSPIDVLAYDLDLGLDMVRRRLSGTAGIELMAVDDGIATVDLDMDLGLRALSVVLLSDHRYPYDGPRELTWTHQDDRLTVDLPRPLPAGDVIELQIAYGGAASRFGYGVNWTQWNGAPMMYTFAEPFGARVWFPCNDRPDDKALVDLRVTVPSSTTTASNGLAVDEVDNGDGSTTTTWSSRYPVSTYLVVLNAGPFTRLQHDYTAISGATMPVHTYVFPEAAGQADIALANTPDMIETLAPLYGEYPFVEEKYGNCVTYFGGGMEHQTLTTYSLDALSSDWAPWLNVHELGHQWWGDWVTCNDWKELWLNEGFATLTEWLWAEHLGPGVLADYLEDANWRGWFLGPLYDNPVAFSDTVYDKGAWVLRMLRHTLGDDDFFAGVAEYRARHAGGGATSEQLRSAFEDASGQDLEWFFDQWVYGANRPRLQYEWEALAGPAIRLTVNQEHTNAPFFRLPMEVAVTTTSGVERHRIDLPAAATATVELDLQAGATGIELDPDNWILAEISPASAPDLELGPEFPGPFDGGVLRGGQETTVTVPMTNTGGSPLDVSDFLAWDGTAWTAISPTAPFSIQPGATVDAVLTFAPRGPGAADDYLVIISNDPSHGGQTLVQLTGRGALSAGPRLAAHAGATFGATPVGAIAERTIQISNLGDEPLTVAGTLSGDGFALASLVPTTVGAGQTSEVFLRFQPPSSGSFTGALTLATNDPARPEHVVNLSGEGLPAPRVALLPAVLSLGLGPAPAPQTLLVANQGDAALTVNAISMDGPFELDGSVSLPVVLPPSGTLELDVRISSGATGELRGAVRVATDDPALHWATAPVTAMVTDEVPARSAVPAAASTGGIGGARWTTTATFLNPGDDDLALDLAFRPAGQRADAPVDLSLSVPARGQRHLADVVGAMGYDGAGGLTLRAEDADLVAVTRTFSREQGGTFGQHIGAVAGDELLSSDDTAVLAGLAGNDGFHTNVGILNLGEAPLTVRLTFFAADGTRLGEAELVAIAGGYAQEVSVLEALTADRVRGAWAEITTDDADASYTAWGSVVDDGSHDPTFIAPVRTPTTHQVVAAIASLEGLNGTMWSSDVTLVNVSDEAVEVTVTYRPPGSQQFTMTSTVPPRSALFLEDLAHALAGVRGDGPLWIEASDGIVATSRIHTTGPTGTYGQLVPAVAASDAIGPGESAVVAGLRSGDGFRSNLGLTSLASVETTVTARFSDDRGTELGTLEIVLPPRSFVQQVRVLSHQLGYTGTAWVELTSDDSAAAFVAHVSVVDGTSGDPAYIPAARFGG